MSNGCALCGEGIRRLLGFSLPYLRYQLLAPGQLGPDPSQWQFTDQGFRSMFPAANTQDQMSIDLSAFRRHGGKLIIWQGWADQAIPTFGTVDYYHTLVSRMGGLAATQQFARMFLFPTVLSTTVTMQIRAW